MAGSKKITYASLFVMVLVCMSINNIAADDKPKETCCGGCFSVCSTPLNGQVNLLCLKKCWNDCAKTGQNCGPANLQKQP
ncbi:hypothetical protein DCAR_0624057 [Daucus carota subsp. sativus]|uniref:Thionin-like protein n=1 Tax=Daucus carota subsp. sativus TaxID=79200 RepID=A0A161ZS16_DAUCS|nr:hypothetical protein DCAR_0624057 [Daucus carota subsp. sativus]